MMEKIENEEEKLNWLAAMEDTILQDGLDTFNSIENFFIPEQGNGESPNSGQNVDQVYKSRFKPMVSGDMGTVIDSSCDTMDLSILHALWRVLAAHILPHPFFLVDSPTLSLQKVQGRGALYAAYL